MWDVASFGAVPRGSGDDLETLCLIRSWIDRIDGNQPLLYLRHSCFPKLRELWLGGLCLANLVFLDQTDSSIKSCDVRAPRFPALLRAHIVDPIHSEDFRLWPTYAPALVSLRIWAVPVLLASARWFNSLGAVLGECWAWYQSVQGL